MKTISSVLTLVVLAAIATQASSDPPDPVTSFKPTWKSDEFTPPVYTSPNLALPTNQWPATNMPVRTNWPYPKMPAPTNWPSTNIPSITNWPAPKMPTNPPPSTMRPLRQ
jgi:hypothetical protein